MKSAKTDEMKSNSCEQFPQESPPLRSKDVGRLIACISSIAVATFMIFSTGKRRRKTSSNLVQRTTGALSHISNHCSLRIFGFHGFLVESTQFKGWKMLQGFWRGFYVINTSHCPLCHSSLVCSHPPPLLNVTKKKSDGDEESLCNGIEVCFYKEFSSITQSFGCWDCHLF